MIILSTLLSVGNTGLVQRVVSVLSYSWLQLCLDLVALVKCCIVNLDLFLHQSRDWWEDVATTVLLLLWHLIEFN